MRKIFILFMFFGAANSNSQTYENCSYGFHTPQMFDAKQICGSQCKVNSNQNLCFSNVKCDVVSPPAVPGGKGIRIKDFETHVWCSAKNKGYEMYCPKAQDCLEDESTGTITVADYGIQQDNGSVTNATIEKMGNNAAQIKKLKMKNESAK